MKKFTVTPLIALALTLFLLGDGYTKQITLRFAHQNPESGLSSKNCVSPWLKQVEEATGGKVKIQPYYGQTLAKGKDMWNAVKMGITDIGWAFHGYWPGMTPVTDVISLPAMSFKSAEKGSEVLWKLYEKYPAIQDEFKDVKVLLFYTSPPYTLITREKPVKNLDDLKGMKIRMTGGGPTDMMKALGGIPMLIPMPDNYISLQKGVIDGMGAPWEAIHVWRFYEVVDYYTEVPFPAVYFSIIMNKRKWDSLPEDIQQAIMSVGGVEGSKFWGRHFFDDMRQTGIEKVKSIGKGDNIIELTAEERQKWIDLGGKPVWESWVADMEKKGVANAREILNTTIELGQQQ
ncbi:TRAP transporter substrate-binding protein [Desulforhopalus singaporensis]|uniref:TRAP-type C4-dicarboxylate transport system, substrate-binding protein n=1 Tax=Desulforhopalus singaporensis TaxID=91360 RepID=A0A1H0ITV9_9BACT|nr:TRAP transporter substrate-binding protein [Desulforhopalus singaporensis]SDO34829.1 TRAP-type C4-dicarboxylate transport system, substrate-binding protein [Desulforhopalus singaporensis]